MRQRYPSELLHALVEGQDGLLPQREGPLRRGAVVGGGLARVGRLELHPRLVAVIREACTYMHMHVHVHVDMHVRMHVP